MSATQSPEAAEGERRYREERIATLSRLAARDMGDAKEAKKDGELWFAQEQCANARAWLMTRESHVWAQEEADHRAQERQRGLRDD